MQKMTYISNIKDTITSTLVVSCSSEQNKNVHRDTVMAAVHRLCSACLPERYCDRCCAAAVANLCTACDLLQSTALVLAVRSSLKKGRMKSGVFTCVLFLSAIWSCMFGTQCSRYPYTGPYTWRYISVQSCPVCFQACLCTS